MNGNLLTGPTRHDLSINFLQRYDDEHHHIPLTNI